MRFNGGRVWGGWFIGTGPRRAFLDGAGQGRGGERCGEIVLVFSADRRAQPVASGSPLDQAACATMEKMLSCRAPSR